MTDDQPQKPECMCLTCGKRLANEYADCDCGKPDDDYDGPTKFNWDKAKPNPYVKKPDATAREWSILCVGDIADGSDKIVVTEGPWNSNDGSIKVIEKSAYDALKARVAELEAKPILGVSHFYEAALIEKNARIAELEADVSETRHKWNAEVEEYEKSEAALVAALEWIAVGHKGGPKIGSECQRKAQEALKAHKGGG